MKVIFHTSNISKMLYRQIIYKYVADHMIQAKDWIINIYPVELSEESSFSPFVVGHDIEINTNLPHGFTGNKKVDVYVKDVKDFGLIVIQNSFVICHELAHMILMIVFKNKGIRRELRNDDKGGNKKGSMMNIWTSEVHDREIEKNLRYMTVYYQKTLKWIPMTLRVINIIDLVNDKDQILKEVEKDVDNSVSRNYNVWFG